MDALSCARQARAQTARQRQVKQPCFSAHSLQLHVFDSVDRVSVPEKAMSCNNRQRVATPRLIKAPSARSWQLTSK